MRFSVVAFAFLGNGGLLTWRNLLISPINLLIYIRKRNKEEIT
jgi:hypothetical protein